MTLEDARSRCWLEVDLDVLRANFRAATALVSGKSEIIPVLKANAYGMGANEVGRVLAEEGIKLFAVATGDEAEALQAALPEGCRVLTLGLVGKAQASRMIRAGMPHTLFSEAQGRMLVEAARSVVWTADVHVKIDTGLHRLGLDPETAPDYLEQLYRSCAIRISSLYTHLGIHTQELDFAQMERLRAVRDELMRRGIEVPMIHAADSIGMVRYPEGHMDAVRVGAFLYGVGPHVRDGRVDCENVARFQARVSQVRMVRAGELIGYDDDHPLVRDTMVASISAGYIDGVPRMARDGETWSVEIRGQYAPVIGIACMDQMMVDVSEIPEAAEGDVVTFVGGRISVEEYARMGRLNHNEVWARIGRRVPRVYYEGGKPVSVSAEVGIG